ncbi:PAQR family membrane homeostasis protein TrhA [Embleya scabrispora]|uniref:PAQR family membrane homeostasis protein TrhA n=1 Tax=Embleya scabrispora TaxID=159449 RepID=UPI00068B9EF1|nr:hemolysin III family protein [Embleya scabrispora]MYS83314.1 hemolysin III family protein [Streptomyces sp. SID5474]
MSVDARALTAPLTPMKPKLRGWIHAGTFPLAVASGIVLVALAGDTKSRIACGVFALTAAMLFGTSGVYHRGNWGPRGEAVLRRLDHANIFLIIAGTYTPLTILLLGKSDQILLWVVWIGALAGIGFRVFWIGAPRWLYTPIYVALGWAAVFYLPEFMREGGVAVVVLVIVGGVLYSLGAVVYGIKRPNPSPQWFGFHEVFHAFTLLAFASHFVAVALVALD